MSITCQPALAPAKQKFPRDIALPVARELCAILKPVTARLIVAGSLRRRKDAVGDIEVLYIPKFELRRSNNDLFASLDVNLADETIARMEASRILDRRKNVNGAETFGPMNKLMRHITGVPVDLFAATESNWWNYLVCRTGPAESNTRIAMAAQARGWRWNPYDVGFTRIATGEVREMHSEADVFAFVAMPYAEPWQR